MANKPVQPWNAGSQPIDQSWLSRAASRFRNLFSGSVNQNQNTSSTPPPFAPPFDPTVSTVVNWRIQVAPQDWFGPGQPLSPVAPPETAGRQFDYPMYSNIDVLQKPREGVDFPVLRALVNSYDLLGMLVDTRLDQLCKLSFNIGYKDQSKKADKACDAIFDFLQMPDGEHIWQDWLRSVARDMLEIDAATVFPRQKRGGGLYALEYVDGATINRIIDSYGRTPVDPDPAYQQRLKGLPAVNYTRTQLIYKPRNISSYKLFGTSPVERLVLLVQTALNRDVSISQYYTDGSVPDLVVTTPPEWTQKQLGDFRDYWNGILRGNTAERRTPIFVPGGSGVIDTKERILKDVFDEWIARKACYCFGMSPQPFVSMMNRATAETADQQSKEEGIGPHMAWVKALVDTIVAHPLCFNRPDMEFSFEDAEETDPAVKANVFSLKVRNGAATIDEWREADGLDPLPDGLGAEPMIYTATGAELLDTVVNPPEPAPAAALPGQPLPSGQGAPPAGGGAPVTPAKKPGASVGKAKRPKVDPVVPEMHTDVDVPYGFGISEDGHCVYRDRRIPSQVRVGDKIVDVDITCLVHELTEFAHVQDGEDYNHAHEKATVAEEALVRGLGVDPKDYEAALAPFLAAALEAAQKGDAHDVPEDLARYPYEDSGTLDLIGGAEKLAKRDTKKKSEPNPRKVAKLAAVFAKALKASAREVGTQYAHAVGKAQGKSFVDSLKFPALYAVLDQYTAQVADAAEGAFTDVLVEVGADSEPVFGIANRRAQQIAEDRAAELIGSDADGGELADATRTLIQGTIADAFENGWSSSELTDALESAYGFSADRAAVIAETEMRMAIGAGAIEGARASGVVTGKQWLLSNDEGVCDECQAAADQGVIGLDEDFDTDDGDDTVPAHPNCRCVVVFITGDDDDEADTDS